MRECGCLLRMVRKDQLLLLVNGLLPTKEAASFNSKAMNAIFNAVFMKKLMRISNVEIAHTTWNILQIMHEGTKAVKINKLQ